MEQIAQSAEIRKKRKTRQGTVISNKGDKTITVNIEMRIKHPLYAKFIKKTKKLYAHDEKNECSVGDIVRVVETRPLSKMKRWRIDTIVEKVK